MKKIYIFIILLISFAFGQLDSGYVNVEQLAKNELKKDIKELSIGKIIKRSCCGGCAYGFLGFTIMPEIGFWGILLGSLYPNIALIKKNQTFVESDLVYPKSLVSNEQKKEYLKIYDEEKKKKRNGAQYKSCIVGAIGFFTVMHILMNSDVYFGWFPTAG